MDVSRLQRQTQTVAMVTVVNKRSVFSIATKQGKLCLKHIFDKMLSRTNTIIIYRRLSWVGLNAKDTRESENVKSNIFFETSFLPFSFSFCLRLFVNLNKLRPMGAQCSVVDNSSAEACILFLFIGNCRHSGYIAVCWLQPRGSAIIKSQRPKNKLFYQHLRCDNTLRQNALSQLPLYL